MNSATKMRKVVYGFFLLPYLFENSDEHLVTEVTLGGLRVGVDDEGVGDFQTMCHLNVHPWRAA